MAYILRGINHEEAKHLIEEAHRGIVLGRWVSEKWGGKMFISSCSHLQVSNTYENEITGEQDNTPVVIVSAMTFIKPRIDAVFYLGYRYKHGMGKEITESINLTHMLRQLGRAGVAKLLTCQFDPKGDADNPYRIATVDNWVDDYEFANHNLYYFLIDDSHILITVFDAYDGFELTTFGEFIVHDFLRDVPAPLAELAEHEIRYPHNLRHIDRHIAYDTDDSSAIPIDWPQREDESMVVKYRSDLAFHNLQMTIFFDELVDIIKDKLEEQRRIDLETLFKFQVCRDYLGLAYQFDSLDEASEFLEEAYPVLFDKLYAFIGDDLTYNSLRLACKYKGWMFSTDNSVNHTEPFFTEYSHGKVEIIWRDAISRKGLIEPYKDWGVRFEFRSDGGVNVIFLSAFSDEDMLNVFVHYLLMKNHRLNDFTSLDYEYTVYKPPFLTQVFYDLHLAGMPISLTTVCKERTFEGLDDGFHLYTASINKQKE